MDQKDALELAEEVRKAVWLIADSRTAIDGTTAAKAAHAAEMAFLEAIRESLEECRIFRDLRPNDVFRFAGDKVDYVKLEGSQYVKLAATRLPRSIPESWYRLDASQTLAHMSGCDTVVILCPWAQNQEVKNGAGTDE